MPLTPSSRSRLSAALRQAARFWGPWPSLTRQPSSPSVTSRTQWSLFSMCQCLRQNGSSRLASARWEARLVMACCTSTVSLPLRRERRSSRQTWAKPGQLRYSARRELASRCRRTMRPCPLWTSLALDSCCCRCFSPAGGKSGPKLGLDGCLQLRLVVFDNQKVVASAVDHLLTVIPLAEHGISGAQAPLQDQRLQDLQSRLVLVRLAIHRLLAEDAAGLLVQQRQQMHAPLVSGQSAAQCFA